MSRRSLGTVLLGEFEHLQQKLAFVRAELLFAKLFLDVFFSPCRPVRELRGCGDLLHDGRCRLGLLQQLFDHLLVILGIRVLEEIVHLQRRRRATGEVEAQAAQQFGVVRGPTLSLHADDDDVVGPVGADKVP